MSTDKLEQKIESLSEKIRAITFRFQDANLEKEADESKEEAIAALENYLDLANTDLDNRNHEELIKNEDTED